LPLQLAQVEEAGALHLPAARHLDPIDAGRIQREDALHTHAVAHLAHGEGGAHVRALPADHHALEDLDAFLVALADLRVHPHGVANPEAGDLSPRFRFDVPLLHQLDCLRTHLNTRFTRRSCTAPLNP